MSADDLAEELADFWFTAIARVGWEQRLKILKEIHAQLRADLQTQAEYHAVCPRFVAALIDRLGDPAIENDAQAEIYASSLSDQHRLAARAWSHRGPTISDWPGVERRRHHRQPLESTGEIWILGHAVRCRFVDLSQSGARVLVEEAEPSTGTTVQLAMPGGVVCDATVVFRSHLGVGLRFADPARALRTMG